MPRLTPLPQREKEISARFREARETRGFSQATLALRVGVDGARLRNYEHLRSPFPYWLGARIAAETDHCQRWLATGKTPKSPCLKVNEKFTLSVSKQFTFSTVYDRVLGPEIDDAFASLAKLNSLSQDEIPPQFWWWCEPIGLAKGSVLSPVETSLFRELQSFALAMEPRLRERFTSELHAVMAKYISSHSGEIDERILWEKGRAERDQEAVAELLSRLNQPGQLS